MYKRQAQSIIGTIPVDSIYTPVRKVNYTVENTRVGDATDYDKLTLEVWTNGTIDARDAVSLGAVSYTHLDVYKRQTRRWATCWWRTRRSVTT